MKINFLPRKTKQSKEYSILKNSGKTDCLRANVIVDILRIHEDVYRLILEFVVYL